MNIRSLIRFLRYFIVCQILCFFLHTRTDAQEANNVTFHPCHSVACESLSRLVRINRDTSVNPCEDFYEYACGNFIKTHTVSPGFYRYTVSTPYVRDLRERQYRLLQQLPQEYDSASAAAAKVQFKACMNESELDELGLADLLHIVQENGGWPMILPGEFRFTKDWQQVQDTYTRMTGKGTLYTVLVLPFLVRSTNNAIVVDQPAQFPATSLNRSDPVQVEKFVQFIATVAEKFAEASGASVPRARLEQDARDVYRLSKRINEIRHPDEFRKRGTGMTVAEAEREFKKRAANATFDLLTALQTIYRDVQGVTLTEDEVINVREMNYMRRLMRLIERTDPRVILNYIQFHFVERYISFTTTEMRNLIYETYDTRPVNRTVLCTMMPNLRKALSRLYVKHDVIPFKVAVAKRLLSDLKFAIKVSILRTSFLDEPTIQAAIAKLDNLVSIVGYTDFFASDGPVDEYYSAFTMGNNFLKNILNYHEITYRKELALLRVPNDFDERRTSSDMDPSSPTINYRVLQHRLEIPAALLNPPTFDVIVPHFTNYAGLGSLITLLLSDLYGEIGMFFDDTGVVGQWVSNATYRVFQERAQCYEEQFQNHTIKELDDAGLHFDLSSASFRPLLASLDFSLKYAYEAHRAAVASGKTAVLPYLSELNIDQQFFLSFASMQCETVNPQELFKKLEKSLVVPARTKVNAAVKNFPEFSRSFNCDVGTPMNSPKKCTWFD